MAAQPPCRGCGATFFIVFLYGSSEYARRPEKSTPRKGKYENNFVQLDNLFIGRLDNTPRVVYKIDVRYAGRFFITYCTIKSEIHHN
ncbi:MAG: hypothetical protein A2W03_12205 [Candidatus Aminicenantes bacterium RBG_16_63_16]|nr:MAG: hypothetical protein A2W03_12205 [Candidatus Aminicenantes bacterium RBG_16_63_16]